MIAKPLFRKNYLLFTGTILFCFALFFTFSFLINSITRESRERMRPPHATFTRLLNATADPVETLREFKKTEDPQSPFRIDIVDASGKSILDGSQVLDTPLKSEELEQLKKGETVFEPPKTPGPPDPVISPLKVADHYLTLRINPHGRPPGPGGPRGPFPPPGPPPPGAPLPPLFFTSLISFVVCILISVGLAMLVFFSSYKKRAQEAMKVLEEMKTGNLNARMPMGRLDELAPLTMAFNHMADEIQRLMESLKSSDRKRRELLQDLAHDLRTPLASLKTFFETLESAGDRVSEAKKKEIYQLSLGEIHYFSNLVEDLLFLAQISEPNYVTGVDRIDLQNEIESQINVFQQRNPHLTFEVKTTDNKPFLTSGSQRLVARLLRNAMANACSFAKTKIVVQLKRQDEQVFVQIIDDGPGFSEKALREFGMKKASREIVNDHDQKRISVGIGSVIMKEIAQVHSGTVSADNQREGESLKGACVTLALPSVV